MTLDNLHQQLQTFFRTDKFEIKPLTGGASTRKYYEINFKKKLYFPSKRILLMSIPVHEIDSLTDYVHTDFYLNRVGIPTPRLYEMNEQFGWIFLEYQNNPTILQYLKNNPNETPTILEKLIEFLVVIQERCQFNEQCPAFRRCFDREKYLYEFNFHVKEQLLFSYYKRQLSEQQFNDFQQFSVEVSETLDTEDKVFVHRDFQSSNIFYDEAQDDLPFKIIDFQDARYGLRVYDLVSCLWDSYIAIADDLREALLEKFFQHLTNQGTSRTKSEFQKLVDYAVIQRKLHDAGAFAYNFNRTGENKFKSFISAAIQMAVDRMKQYDHFREMTQIFEKIGEKPS